VVAFPLFVLLFSSFFFFLNKTPLSVSPPFAKNEQDRVAFSTNASDISKGRHFFESIAAEMGFGTKEQWYFIPRKRLSKADGLHSSVRTTGSRI
jgi:hypothetical protein